MMKMRKLPLNAAKAIALLGMAMLLTGCATATRVPAPSGHQVASSNEEVNGKHRGKRISLPSL